MEAQAIPVEARHGPAATPAPTTPAPVPPAGDDGTLTGRFRATATAHPDRTAVRGRSGAYSYRELDRLTDATAHRLAAAAPAVGRIALLCEHDLGAVVGIWSVLKSGNAYVPLDPRQPDGRLTRILADADVSAIAYDTPLAQRARSLAQETPLVELPSHPGTGPAPEGGEPRAPLPEPTGGSVAYLLHTSGSTGRPKAVVQSHRNVLGHALEYARRIRIGPSDEVSLTARYTFDAAVMDVFGALLSGAGLNVLEPLLPAAELRAAHRRAGTTVLHCTPSLFRHLLSDLNDTGGTDGTGKTLRAARRDLPVEGTPSPGAAPDPDPDLASVRVAVLGGEEAVGADLRQFRRHFRADAVLVNGLGPTECTLILQHRAGPADADRPSVPVGHPVEGVRVELQDADGRPSATAGELVVIGERVALGYWRQAEATAAAFGTRPDGTRYYRTGDLVRRLPDGSLVHDGRKDRQVKIRGHRVEPGEVENRLRAHPSVAQAAVVLDAPPGSVPQLVAYVTSAAGLPAEEDELADYLGRQLPEYAVPGRTVVLERMPLGPTGKLDRAALPAPPERPEPGSGLPTTPVERQVAGLWCDVLGTAAAGVGTNFIAAGGDSIRLLELLTRIRADLGVEIRLAEFLRAPTIATLALLVERDGRLRPSGREHQ
ncbi:AMP-binding protein [Streptomyces sp. NPDC060223]|uniref:non-ribosomal peptide synthetase n=1 Tax=unclassified Streptomyces TaxID=2593676 RepID=UPI00362B4E6E